MFGPFRYQISVNASDICMLTMRYEVVCSLVLELQNRTGDQCENQSNFPCLISTDSQPAAFIFQLRRARIALDLVVSDTCFSIQSVISTQNG
jgi:hypothetical protein